MKVTYSYAVRVEETGEAFALPPQGEALACPQVGTLFEIVGGVAGTVIEAATIVEEQPQGDSGGEGRRAIVHSVVLGPARKEDPGRKAAPAPFPRAEVERAMGGRAYALEWTVELSANRPAAPPGELFAGQVREWTAQRDAPRIVLMPGAPGVPSPGGNVGVAFLGQPKRAYVIEVEGEPIDCEIHFSALTDAGRVFATATVRNDRPGRWLAIADPGPGTQERCRFVAAPAGVEIIVQRVRLHALLLG